MIAWTARFLALLAWSGLLCSALGAAELGHAPAEWHGVWLLDRDAGAAAISTLASAQVHALLGTTLSIDGSSPALGGLPCPLPSFEASSESKEDFASDFRVEPAKVGITNDPVRLLHVDCRDYAYDFVRLATNQGLVIYQGHFFGTAKALDR